MRPQIIALGVLCRSLSALGAAEAPPFTVGGGIDGYVAVDLAARAGEAGGPSLFPVRQAQPTVYMALAEARFSLDGWRGKLSLGVGDAFDALHAPTPGGRPKDDLWRYLVEANLGYTVPVGRGLAIDAGLLPTHLGFEVLATWDNWNWTHALGTEVSPYYQAGVRVTYPFTDSLSASLMWWSGWNVAEREHDMKAGGAQVAFTSERLNATLNLYAGQLPDDGAVRCFGEFIAVVTPVPKLKAAALLDGGADVARGANAYWFVVAAYVRYQPFTHLAVTARSDLVDDRGGTILGGVARAAEGTLTVDVPFAPLLFRVEARIDRANAPLHGGASERLLLLSAISAHF